MRYGEVLKAVKHDENVNKVIMKGQVVIAPVSKRLSSNVK